MYLGGYDEIGIVSNIEFVVRFFNFCFCFLVLILGYFFRKRMILVLVYIYKIWILKMRV